MHVLLALDGTEVGERAAAAIAAWAAGDGARVTLFRVLHPSEVHGTLEMKNLTFGLTPQGTMSGQKLSVHEPLPTVSEDRSQAFARARSEREDALRAVAATWFPGIESDVCVVLGTDTAAAIVRAAKEHGADFIAMAARGRGGLGEALFGSVHEDVVRHSSVPVLVVGPGSAAPAATPEASSASRQ